MCVYHIIEYNTTPMCQCRSCGKSCA